MTWTIDHVAERIITETSGLLGDDIRKRQEAIVLTWLETIERQAVAAERERCAKWIETQKGQLEARERRDGGPPLGFLIEELADGLRTGGNLTDKLKQYIEMHRQLVALIEAGKDNAEADKLRDAMDHVWYALTADECTEFERLVQEKKAN